MRTANSSVSAGRIAVDAMGGDLGPEEVVAAVKLALHHSPDLNPITLVGDESVLNPLLARAGLRVNQRLAVLHAPDVITMDDKPLVATRASWSAAAIPAR
jgi:glycerol-3-phosphate acyltransferase PlsX